MIKLEAHLFTRYGTLKARVPRVSPDSVVDQQRGLVFPAKLELNERTLSVDGQPATLSPGTTVSAEGADRAARVIQHFCSSIAKAVREAGRER